LGDLVTSHNNAKRHGQVIFLLLSSYPDQIETSISVSIIIPVYNGGENIRNVLNSVFKQQNVRFEVIVIDDCSIDNTPELLKMIARDHMVKLITHSRNQGLAASLNEGINMASGDFILTLHQDCELIGSDWIERALKIFREEKNVGILTGRSVWDSRNFTFLHKAFMIINRHASIGYYRHAVQDIAFSEDKCDVYVKKLLCSIGGFPEKEFRISGEDQFVSNSIRNKGYRVLAARDLCFRQNYGKSLERTISLFKKGYTFGRTMPGILKSLRVSVSRIYLRKNAGARGRTLNRLWSMINAFTFLIVLPLAIAFSVTNLLYLYIVPEIFLRLVYYLDVSMKSNLIESAVQHFRLVLTGFMFDAVFFFGFCHGIILLLLKKRL
jgi:glycosyltransferase involved in cell wall biosynthesis